MSLSLNKLYFELRNVYLLILFVKKHFEKIDFEKDQQKTKKSLKITQHAKLHFFQLVLLVVARWLVMVTLTAWDIYSLSR